MKTQSVNGSSSMSTIPIMLFPGSGNLKPEEEDLRRAQRRIRELEMENEILKKSRGILCKKTVCKIRVRLRTPLRIHRCNAMPNAQCYTERVLCVCGERTRAHSVYIVKGNHASRSHQTRIQRKRMYCRISKGLFSVERSGRTVLDRACQVDHEQIRHQISRQMQI